MISIALLFVICFGSLIVGRRCLGWLRIELIDPILTIVYSIAIGLGLYAYTVLFVGITGYLTPIAISSALLLITVTCGRGCTYLLSDWKKWKSSLSNEVPNKPLKYVCVIVFLLIGAAAMVNCFVPPAAHEWDALAYHLAAPNVYVSQHRILFLPTDHQIVDQL